MAGSWPWKAFLPRSGDIVAVARKQNMISFLVDVTDVAPMWWCLGPAAYPLRVTTFRRLVRGDEVYQRDPGLITPQYLASHFYADRLRRGWTLYPTDNPLSPSRRRT